jgi:hypothetical protein
MAETLFQFGGYVGEVMVRHANGVWITLPEDHPLGGGWPVVELPNDRIAKPIGKVFKRVANGPGDAIPYFYSVMVGS